MKNKLKYLAGAAAVGAVLLTGCGSQRVSQTCSTDVMGIKVSLIYGAKSENDPVDTAKMEFVLPMHLLELADVDTSDPEAIKSYVEKTFAGEAGSESSMEVSIGENEVTVTSDAAPELLDSDSATAPSFKDVKSGLTEQLGGMFTCD